MDLFFDSQISQNRGEISASSAKLPSIAYQSPRIDNYVYLGYIIKAFVQTIKAKILKQSNLLIRKFVCLYNCLNNIIIWKCVSFLQMIYLSFNTICGSLFDFLQQYSTLKLNMNTLKEFTLPDLMENNYWKIIILLGFLLGTHSPRKKI